MAIEPPHLMTISQYARHRGCVPSAVHKAIASGRISYLEDARGRAWIDPKTADREWRENTDWAKVRW